VKSPTQRRLAIAALLLAPALAACGFNAQTEKVYQPAVGVNDRDGTVDVLNAVIVSGTEGSGTFAGTFVNNDQENDDRLDSVSGPDVTASRRTISVPAGEAVPPSEGGTISLTGDAIKPGSFVEVTFAFSSGQSTTLHVPVVEASGEYADVPLPAASESAGSSDSE
jgi:hypothetical protein